MTNTIVDIAGPYGRHGDNNQPTTPPPAVTPAQAEAAAEQTPHPDGAVRVRLGDDTDGVDIWVPDRRRWRNSALRALNSGDFQSWADRTLLEEDAEAWEDYDPTLEEIEEFFERWTKLSGDEPGKRGRSKLGSRRTSRR